MKTKTSMCPGHLPKNFDALNRMHQLRPIHDDVEYDNAAEVLDRLAVLDRRTEDQEDYLQTLSQLVAAYDDEHFAQDLSNITPLETLEYLLERNGMNGSQMGKLLAGQPSLGGKILRGERQLSKAHIKKLSEHFSVNPGLFL